MGKNTINTLKTSLLVGCFIFWKNNDTMLAEMESSRTSLASRTHFEVLGLGLEASSPRKLACPRLEDSTIFWIVKILWSAWKIFWKTFFCGDRLKNFCEDLSNFFFSESTCACVLGLGLEHSCPWPRECLSSERLSLALASDFFVSLALASSLVSSTPPLHVSLRQTSKSCTAKRTTGLIQ